MLNKIKYPIAMEITGKFACFNDPLGGSDGLTYFVPTWSASIGIFQSILFMKTVEICPTVVKICSPVQLINLTSNYNGSKRKSDLITKDCACQRCQQMMVDVCFQIFGNVCNTNVNRIDKYLSANAKKYVNKGINNAHSYQEQFFRRLKRGQNHRRPNLGRSELLADYFGPIRSETQVNQTINITYDTMLYSCFDQPTFGSQVKPVFKQDVSIVKGALHYV